MRKGKTKEKNLYASIWRGFHGAKNLDFQGSSGHKELDGVMKIVKNLIGA